MKNKLLLIFTACFLIAATFVLGAFSSSFTNGVGVPWLKVLANKLPKEIARDLNVDFSYPRSIQSSMFTFNTSHVFPERGIFQIAAKDEGMHRIEMLNDRVVLDEQLDMGGRVRDFEITNSGMLFIAYDEGNLIFLKPKKMR